MNYKKIHDQIIERAKNRILIGYKERHHIIPRCLGGSDAKENLVELTAREHYIIHWLLYLIYPENKKLFYAFHMMNCVKDPNQPRYINSRMHEIMCIEKSKRMSGPGNPRYGKPVSESTRQKLSLAQKNRKIKPNTGKTFSVEWKNNLSKANTGVNNPFYGKSHSEETKQKIKATKKLNPLKGKAFKKLIDLENNIVYNSRKEFMNLTGIGEYKMYKMFKQNKLKNL